MTILMSQIEVSQILSIYGMAECLTAGEIAEKLGLEENVVTEVLNALCEMHVVASVGTRHCNFEAISQLKRQLRSVSETV